MFDENFRQQMMDIYSKILELMNEQGILIRDSIQMQTGCENGPDAAFEKELLDDLVFSYEGVLSDDVIRGLFKQILSQTTGLWTKSKEKRKELLVNRKSNPNNTIVQVGSLQIGGGEPFIIGGPCSVENEEQMDAVASHLRMEGIVLMRGGAYKPRTSPYDFQGLGEKGLQILRETADRYGMVCVSEIVSPEHMEMASEYLDMIQIGARNMQNFELLKATGAVQKPILLKRGLSATIEETIYAAEYIYAHGNGQIVLCERGIRTYEKATRNTLDISAVPILKQETHLPVLVDVSHSTGRKDIMFPIAKAALAAGADGLVVETHNQPEIALSDAKQQINLEQFSTLVSQLRQSGYLKQAVLS